MADMSLIEVESAGPVRTVMMTRPEKRNALTQDMLDDMRAAFSLAPPADERVTVLRGEGKVFCSGLDLAQRRERLGKASPIEDMLRAVETYPLPVIAVVQGDAIAGGNELALHCDFVVAAETARFAMPLARIGLALNWFLAKKLLEVAGPVATREFLLIGDLMPAAWMHEKGIIHAVAPADELEARAGALIERLSRNAPLSMRAMKRILVREMEFRDGIEHGDLDAQVLETNQSEDTKEGIAARLEKRTPVFKGR